MIDNNRTTAVKNILFLNEIFNQSSQVKLTLGGDETINTWKKRKELLSDEGTRCWWNEK